MLSPMSIVHYSKSVIVQTHKARLQDKLTGNYTHFATQNEVICTYIQIISICQISTNHYLITFLIMINGSTVSVWVSMIDSFRHLVSERITLRENVGTLV